MKNVKGRLLATLVVYFAGFATAIYGLAPVDRSNGQGDLQNEALFSSFTKSNEFALDCGVQFRKWVCLAEAAAAQAGDYIQTKMAAEKIVSDDITCTNSAASERGIGQ